MDEEIGKASEAVKELDAEVTSYTNLLKAAQSRLHKAREQKERLIDNKQKLLDKKLKFLQSNTVARSIGVPVGVKVQKEIISEPVKRPLSAADVIEIDQVTKASPISNNSSRKALSSHPTHPARVSPFQIQKSPSLPISLGLFAPRHGYSILAILTSLQIMKRVHLRLIMTLKLE